jgi:cyclopropane-fatty-acyl-phospholipid synthase
MTDALARQARRSGLPWQGVGRALVRRIMGRLACGTLTVALPDGVQLRQRAPAPGPEAEVLLHRWRGLRRLLLGGDIGFAEAYADGDWSSPDLTALLELGARNQARIPGADGGALPVRLLHRLAHLARPNTRAGSRRNIAQHYDLGNAFYARWLDRGMSYSSALFEDPSLSLEAAQDAKQDRILDLLDVRPGQQVLEIGCGWGGLAERIAAAGGHVTGLTVSPAQHAYAEARLRRAGLAARADLRLQDYRDVGGTYDRIVSIEMLEAVGEAWWPTYFETLRSRLRPGGVIVLQSITIADTWFDAYRSRADFIQRHIFPGGMLPAARIIHEQVAQHGLALQSTQSFGASYARTLRFWRDRFHAAWPELAGMGFPRSFERLWTYYLCYCEAGFRAGRVDVGLWRLGHR